MKRTLRSILFVIVSLALTLPAEAITPQTLGDSLTVYAAFPACVAKVKVKNLRVNKQTVQVYTNKTLSGLSMSPEALSTLRRTVSKWVLGHEYGSIKIYSDGYELGELITDRYRPRKHHYTLAAQPAPTGIERNWEANHGLDGRNIALWPSHGLYYNSQLDMWHWQRARMWTIVEDLYSYEFVNTWLVPMFENAGATVFMPRPRIEEGQEIGPSGRPRWMEGARYWLEYKGLPDTIWNVNEGKDDYKDDLQCRGLWVNYLTGGSRANPHQPGLGIQIDACLALHTDGYSAASDSDYIGTLAIYTDHNDKGKKNFPTGTTRLINRDLADYVQTQIVEDIRKQIEPRWPRRELSNAGYCESRYPEVPTVLLEVLSHKNLADIMLGLDPRFQKLFCRAIYKGVGRWIQGEDFIATPLEVEALRVRIEGNELTATWQAAVDTIEPSATPTYYIVYTRENDSEWNEGVRVTKNSYSCPIKPGIRYDIRVAAGNEGGISFPGETMSAITTTGTQAQTLVVNGDYRISGPDWFIDSLRAGIKPGSYPVPYGVCRTYLGEQWNFDKQRDVRENGWRDDDNCGWGMCHMDYVGKEITGNTFDFPSRYIVERGEQSVESSSVQALSEADTTTYQRLIVYLGQANKDLFPSALRTLIERHIDAEREIEIRGAFLGSGLSKEEKQWAEKTLGYTLMAPLATISGVSGQKRTAPDAIKASKNVAARVIQRFPDTGLPCSIQIGKITITTQI